MIRLLCTACRNVWHAKSEDERCPKCGGVGQRSLRES